MTINGNLVFNFYLNLTVHRPVSTSSAENLFFFHSFFFYKNLYSVDTILPLEFVAIFYLIYFLVNFKIQRKCQMFVKYPHELRNLKLTLKV